MYTPYAGAAWMLLHINGTFTMGKLKSSLTNHQCQLQGFGQGMKQNLAVYVVSFISSSMG
jgi:hypothetical protein